MISIEEARALVLDHTRTKLPETVELSAALGRVLARAVHSDVDSPPHDKSLMDGFALNSADLRAGQNEFEVCERVMAGQVPQRPITSGQATQTMTGAPIPAGADAVVMVEQTEAVERGDGRTWVRINTSPLAVGQNVMRRGASLRKGQEILPAGRLLRPSEIGVLAETGNARILTHPVPQAAVLSTGDELVEACEVPAPGQIRNSNGPMLCASLQWLHTEPVSLGIARDNEAELNEKIERGLGNDVLILSGGVSAGVLDLVPRTLQRLGVREVFHKVHLKPGKPLWFGVRDVDDRRTLVFGLPGNPVSSLVCFQLFVRPALARLAGRTPESAPPLEAAMSCDHHQRGDRPTYFPATIQWRGGHYDVRPLPWKGSADQRTLVDANGLILFPAEDRRYVAGDMVKVQPLDDIVLGS